MAGAAMRVNRERSRVTSTMKSRFARFLPLNLGETRTERFEQKAGFKWIHDAMARAQQALETLRETEELHRLLFEKVPHPRFVYDARTLRILVVNAAAIRQYGYSRGEFLRMKVTALSAPECFAVFKGYCRNLSSRQFVTADGRGGIFRHRKKDGRLIDIEVDAALIPLHGRRMFLLLAQDVTEKRRAT